MADREARWKTNFNAIGLFLSVAIGSATCASTGCNARTVQATSEALFPCGAGVAQP